MESERKGTLQEHEKFWAFIFLVTMIVLLVGASQFLHSDTGDPTKDVVLQSKLRIMDAAMTGLIAIAGMAAQALFRISSTDKAAAEVALESAKTARVTAETAQIAADKVPPVTGEAAHSDEGELKPEERINA